MICEICGQDLVEVDNPMRREVRHRRGVTCTPRTQPSPELLAAMIPIPEGHRGFTFPDPVPSPAASTGPGNNPAKKLDGSRRRDRAIAAENVDRMLREAAQRGEFDDLPGGPSPVVPSLEQKVIELLGGSTRSWDLPGADGTCDGCGQYVPLVTAYDTDEHNEPWLCADCALLQPDRQAIAVIALIREAVAEEIHVHRYDHDEGLAGGPDSFYGGMIAARSLARGGSR